jgi:hypothetical protein
MRSRSLLDSRFANGTGVAKADSFINYQSRYSWLNLEHTLNSALPVKVASKGEWLTHNEIFGSMRVADRHHGGVRSSITVALLPADGQFAVISNGVLGGPRPARAHSRALKAGLSAGGILNGAHHTSSKSIGAGKKF